MYTRQVGSTELASHPRDCDAPPLRCMTFRVAVLVVPSTGELFTASRTSCCWRRARVEPVASPSRERHSWGAIPHHAIGGRDVFRAYTLWMIPPFTSLPNRFPFQPPHTSAVRTWAPPFIRDPVSLRLLTFLCYLSFLCLQLPSVLGSHSSAALRRVSQLYVTMWRCDDVLIVAYNGRWYVTVTVAGAWNSSAATIELQEMLTNFDCGNVSDRRSVFVIDKVIKITWLRPLNWNE